MPTTGLSASSVDEIVKTFEDRLDKWLEDLPEESDQLDAFLEDITLRHCPFLVITPQSPISSTSCVAQLEDLNPPAGGQTKIERLIRALMSTEHYHGQIRSTKVYPTREAKYADVGE
ncbi:hypothetical protein EV182_002837 [Spiromyces aspiralis]|uniref:Uncharacterized protein n=1 Tax=Spiromyces aspiralis TaxID=68401 RepID=A0ACC1HDL1_9FUNG|nr:hypothetical protein EV182_002837 [Spiromyces aspiralis]